LLSTGSAEWEGEINGNEIKIEINGDEINGNETESTATTRRTSREFTG